MGQAAIITLSIQPDRKKWHSHHFANCVIYCTTRSFILGSSMLYGSLTPHHTETSNTFSNFPLFLQLNSWSSNFFFGLYSFCCCNVTSVSGQLWLKKSCTEKNSRRTLQIPKLIVNFINTVHNKITLAREQIGLWGQNWVLIVSSVRGVEFTNHPKNNYGDRLVH